MKMAVLIMELALFVKIILLGTTAISCGALILAMGSVHLIW